MSTIFVVDLSAPSACIIAGQSKRAEKRTGNFSCPKTRVLALGAALWNQNGAEAQYDYDTELRGARRGSFKVRRPNGRNAFEEGMAPTSSPGWKAAGCEDRALT